MKNYSLLFIINIIFSVSFCACQCCVPETPPYPSNQRRVHLEFDFGVMPADYYPLSAVSFSPYPSKYSSVSISVNRVTYSNGIAYPMGGTSQLDFDLNYLINNNWTIDVWKNEYIIRMDIVQICTEGCRQLIEQQIQPDNVTVSCYDKIDPANSQNGKTQWTYYKHVTDSLNLLQVTPVFVKCVNCGCQ